jgi:hypothetical protein
MTCGVITTRFVGGDETVLQAVDLSAAERPYTLLIETPCRDE